MITMKEFWHKPKERNAITLDMNEKCDVRKLYKAQNTEGKQNRFNGELKIKDTKYAGETQREHRKNSIQNKTLCT